MLRGNVARFRLRLKQRFNTHAEHNTAIKEFWCSVRFGAGATKPSALLTLLHVIFFPLFCIV